MKVVRYYAPGVVRVEDSPEPIPGRGELRLRIRNCSVCGTDLKIIRHGHRNISPPRVLGHEIAGQVAELGVGTHGWAVGDRVQVIGAIPCGECEDCQRDQMTVCPEREGMGYQYDGGFASYLIVPAKVLAVNGVNHIPHGIDFAEASLAEPLGCVLNAQELIALGSDDAVVVVVGTGPAGCLNVRLARNRTRGKVFLVGTDRASLARAADLTGPDEAICAEDGDVADQVLALTKGAGADVVITAAASARAQEQALRYTARRGRISFFAGLPPDEPGPAIDTDLVHYRELTIAGASSSSPAHNTHALGLIASGTVPVADLITHRLPLDRFTEALDLIERGDALKVTIEP